MVTADHQNQQRQQQSCWVWWLHLPDPAADLSCWFQSFAASSHCSQSHVCQRRCRWNPPEMKSGAVLVFPFRVNVSCVPGCPRDRTRNAVLSLTQLLSTECLCSTYSGLTGQWFSTKSWQLCSKSWQFWTKSRLIHTQLGRFSTNWSFFAILLPDFSRRTRQCGCMHLRTADWALQRSDRRDESADKISLAYRGLKASLSAGVTR